MTRGARPQAAGVIHTDFRARLHPRRTIGYDDYVACGGEAGGDGRMVERMHADIARRTVAIAEAIVGR